MSALGKALGASLVVFLTLIACGQFATPIAPTLVPTTAAVRVTITATPTEIPFPTATPRYPHGATVVGHWNCREKPFGVVIVYFMGGEQVKVITEDGGWAKVSYKEQMCYIVSAALR